MKLNIKDWKTTIAGIISGIVVLAGIIWPAAIDADTGEIIKTATSEIITGVGALIGVITAAVAKDK